MVGPLENIGATIKRGPRFVWLWKILGPPIAVFLLARSNFQLHTSTISVSGPGANYQGPAVYINWHQHLPFLCVHHGQHRRWLLMSSAPYMEPIACWCTWMGVTVVRGAPGERSRELLHKLAEPLRAGASVFLAVDGPAGPGFQVKPGCVKLARAAQVPIIPVAYRSSRGKVNEKRWDRMHTVRAFDDIDLRYGEQLFIRGSESDEAARVRVQKALEDVTAVSPSG